MLEKIDTIHAVPSVSVKQRMRVPTHHVPLFRAFVLGLGTLLLAYLAQGQLDAGHSQEAALLYGVAILLFVIPFRQQLRLPLPVATRVGGRGGWSLLWRLLPGLLAVGAAYWSLRTFQLNVERPAMSAWWLHLASLLLIVLFGFLLDWGAQRQTPPRPDDNTTDEPAAEAGQAPGAGRWWRIGLLLAIVALALFMRLWRFAELPFGTWYDEAEAGLLALRILEDPNYRPIFEGSINIPAHYLYLIAFFFHYIEVSTQSIRLVSVLMGVAMVGAAYLAGRELFGRGWGLVLAFIVAVARWSVNFSRIGMYNISTPFFELLAIGLLLRAFRRGRYADYALAGVTLGLGLCFYVAFQLFIGVVLLFWLLMTLLQRGFLRRTWSGMLLTVVVATLVVMPIATFAYTKPDVYFARTNKTSIFAEKAPAGTLPPAIQQFCDQLSPAWATRCQYLPLIGENTRKHLLMFNASGDPNGRHNLPGEPMLDPWLATLLVLGLALSLVRFWRPRALLLLLWFGIMLLGGILSLGFEAPQSLRAIGTQPAVYLLALVPLHALWRAWRNSGGARYRGILIAPLVLLLLSIGYTNFNDYFYRQANDFAVWNAFSTPETLTANLLRDLDETTEPYVISYFHGHPTLNFIARGTQPYRRLETTDHLPIAWPTDKNVALITNADSRVIFEEAKHYYPNAHFEEFTPPAGGPTVLYYAYLTQNDLTSVQGLNARYYANEDWSAEPVVARHERTVQAEWPSQAPLPLPFSVEWEGVLDVSTYGMHQFFSQGPAQTELAIGERVVLSGTGAVNTALMLAEGKHTLRLRAVGGEGPVSLAWRSPDGGPEIVPPTALYVAPVTSNGLLGKYYNNGDWQGPETLARIDPQLNLYFHIPILPRPYTVEWTGKIAIPEAGIYRFGLESIDEAVLFINEQQLTATPIPNQYEEGSIELSAGLHDIRLRFADRTDHTHINLYWTPPFSGQQPIPAEVLFPPQGNYERIELPDLAQLTFNPNAPVAPVPVANQTLSGNIRLVADGFNAPKGVAVGPDNRLYVADTGNQRVVILSPDGETLGQLEPPTPFIEPFDLAVNPDGELFVLDPSAERLAHFDAAGTYIGDVPADQGVIGRSRGIGIDRQGVIWIANTPGGRIVAINAAGEIGQEIAIAPGEPSQPVDVVVGNDGAIFVTDAGLHKLIRFEATGQRSFAWDIPVANTVDSSHLAVAPNGYLYLSKPEPFLISERMGLGEETGNWSVLPANGNIVKPIGIAVDELGHIWFVDTVGGGLYVIEADLG